MPNYKRALKITLALHLSGEPKRDVRVSVLGADREQLLRETWRITLLIRLCPVCVVREQRVRQGQRLYLLSSASETRWIRARLDGLRAILLAHRWVTGMGRDTGKVYHLRHTLVPVVALGFLRQLVRVVWHPVLEQRRLQLVVLSDADDLPPRSTRGRTQITAGPRHPRIVRDQHDTRPVRPP